MIPLPLFLVFLTQDAAPANDEPYVKLTVNVEICGVLEHSEKGTFIKTSEQRRTGDSPGFGGNSKPPEKATSSPATWELDLSGIKNAAKIKESLEGKTVIVKGKSELRPVAVTVLANGMLHRIVSWESQRRAMVIEIGPVNGKAP